MQVEMNTELISPLSLQGDYDNDGNEFANVILCLWRFNVEEQPNEKECNTRNSLKQGLEGNREYDLEVGTWIVLGWTTIKLESIG